MTIPFVKMHSSGNDFVILDACTHKIDLEEIDVVSWGNRHKGIGFDQLLVVQPPSDGLVDFRLTIFNCDGSEAEQCGNGTACVAKYLVDNRVAIKSENALQTLGGLVETTCQQNSQGLVNNVQVGMGVPTLTPEEIPYKGNGNGYTYTIETSATRPISITPVGMGNPHVVVFVEDVSATDVHNLGRAIQDHEHLPNSANVEFVQVLNKQHVKIRILERGAGQTLGCGSGCCAVVVAGQLTNRLGKSVEIQQPGGVVNVSWEGLGHSVFLNCPAHMVYQGSI
ncbi:MAG: diaminopimelate epimerase [Gammaproteobacteria bacterium]|nr:diaminopimelate epimerase [Gammaproteobacteria bacterium]